jgi:hypothetical protein
MRYEIQLEIISLQKNITILTKVTMTTIANQFEMKEAAVT